MTVRQPRLAPVESVEVEQGKGGTSRSRPFRDLSDPELEGTLAETLRTIDRLNSDVAMAWVYARPVPRTYALLKQLRVAHARHRRLTAELLRRVTKDRKYLERLRAAKKNLDSVPAVNNGAVGPDNAAMARTTAKRKRSRLA